jgi:hypothetical protein
MAACESDVAVSNDARDAVLDEEFKPIAKLEHAEGKKNKAPHDAGLCKHTLS